MMKQLILIVLLIGFLLVVSEIEQTTIQVVIVVPVEWIPYLDWWLSFPGWQPTDQQTPTQQNFHQVSDRVPTLLPIC